MSATPLFPLEKTKMITERRAQASIRELQGYHESVTDALYKLEQRIKALERRIARLESETEWR